MNIFATITRNAMPKLAGNLYTVANLLAKGDDQIVIYENDSQDLTLKFLFDFQKLYKNVHIITEKLNAPRFPEGISHERAQHLANCRNKYMDYVDDTFPNVDYLIVFDSDLCVLTVENFHTMFTKHAAVSSNGLDVLKQVNKERTGWELKSCYYDTWAYQRLEDGRIFLPNEMQPPFPQQGLVEVMSGFGGLAVYRWDIVKDLRYRPYTWEGNSKALCEHGGLNEEIRKKGEKVFIQTEYRPIRQLIPF